MTTMSSKDEGKTEDDCGGAFAQLAAGLPIIIAFSCLVLIGSGMYVDLECGDDVFVFDGNTEHRAVVKRATAGESSLV